MTSIIAATVLAIAIGLALLSLPGWAWSRRWSYKPFVAIAASVPVIEALAFLNLN